MVKNLRVNSKKINDERKYKFFKLGRNVLTISLGITLLLTGCGTDKNDDYYYIPSSDVNFTEQSVLDNPMLKKDQNDYSNSLLNVSENAYSEFINYINNFKTEYDYEKYYNIEEALNRYEQVKNNKTQNHSYSLKEFSIKELLSVVKENNKKYLQQKEQEYVSEFFEEFSDAELQKICEIIISTINYYKDKNLIEDINELKCILGDLKILNKTTLTNAYVTDDNALIISPLMIETLEIKNLDGNVDVYESTITHEVIHLLQKNCRDNNKNAYAIGNSYQFEDLKVNPLFYNWFYEGAAEKLANNKTKYKPLVYEFYINYIESLNLVSSLNVNNTPTSVEETTLSNNLDALYKVFNAKTEDQKKEVINLMFSLDIIETDTEDFVNAVNPNMTDDELVLIKRNLKGSVCETLTKMFYKNLATMVKENKMPLEDVFYLITIFEADVDSHIVYGDIDKYNACESFFKNYMEIQTEFFEYLSSSKNYTNEQIENMFDEYGIVRENGDKNFNLSYLPKAKIEFYDKQLNNLYSSSREQIRDVYIRNSGAAVKK